MLNENELYHHGILGMKWGDRNGPPYPLGSGAHSAREKRHGTKGWTAEAKAEAKKKSSGKEAAVPKKKTRKTAEDISKEVKSKSKGQNGKSSDASKASKESIIQKRKNKFIEQYMAKGYFRSAAETAAKQRMATEIAVGALATVAVAVVAKKAITRIGQDYCDKVIKSGKIIQNIGANPIATFKDSPFYAAINRHDKRAYGSLYPNEKLNMLAFEYEPREFARNYKGIFNNQIQLTKDVRRASVRNARKTLYEQLDSNPEFKRNVLEAISKTAYGGDASTLIKNNPKKFYDRFNQALATPEFQKAGIHKQFYSALEKKGYNAILDINDTRYSGYKNVSKSPTIFFGKSGWEKIGSTKLADATIAANANKYAQQFAAQQMGKSLSVYAGIGVGAKVASDNKTVRQYLEAHPNSELSRKEILDAVKKERKKKR